MVVFSEYVKGCFVPTFTHFLATLQVSQSISHGGPRTQIAIPAQGMIEFRDALTDLLDEFGGDDAGEDSETNCK